MKMKLLIGLFFLVPVFLFSQNLESIDVEVKRVISQADLTEFEIQISNPSDSILFIAISPYYEYRGNTIELYADRVEGDCNIYSVVHFRGEKEVESRVQVLDRIAVAPENSILLRVSLKENPICAFMELEYFFDSSLDITKEKKILGRRGWFTEVNFITNQIKIID